MKASTELYKDNDHAWFAIARDAQKPGYLIDTVEYLVTKGGRGLLLDPGGQEVFPAVFAAVADLIHPECIDSLFLSHQDPDVSSSLPLWLTANPHMKCYTSWVWSLFLPHFGGIQDTFISIPDEGIEVPLGNAKLQAIPAHYLHSSGNFHLYDPQAKILFTGDVGAGLLPEGAAAELFVKNFDRHLEYIRAFHQRWMGANDAKNNWIDRVSRLKIDMLCPQHGAIYEGENVAKFLQWFRDLEVGVNASKANRGLSS